MVHRFLVIIYKLYFYFIYFFYFTILYWFCHTSTWIHHGYTRVPHPEHPSHLPPRTIPLGHPSATSPKHPVSCIEPGLVIYFIYDIIYVSMPCSQIIPLSPSPTESERLLIKNYLIQRLISDIYKEPFSDHQTLSQ